jgi:aromatic-L-amino-acid decarboxylase
VTGALSITPEYLRNAGTEAGAIDYRDWQVPLGRRFRALKLWMVMRHYGLEGLRAHVRAGLAMAAAFEGWVRADERFELAAPRHPSSPLVCFRLKGPDGPNQALLAAVNASGQAFLSHTVLPDAQEPGKTVYVLRMAVGGTFTRMEDVRGAWELIQRLAG